MSGSDDTPPTPPTGGPNPGSLGPKPPLKLHPQQPHSPLFPEPTPEEIEEHKELLGIVNEWRKKKDLPPVIDILEITEEMIPPGMGPGGPGGLIPIGPPMMMGMQGPRPALRPMRQPLFDSEFIVPGMRTNRLLLYTRPVGIDFIHNVQGRVKGQYDTNLHQTSQLDIPMQFSALGFNVYLEDGISEADRAEITRDGLMSFIFAGRRTYANIPLVRMPRLNRTNIIEIFNRFADETGLLKPNPKRLPDEEFNKWKERLQQASPRLHEMFDFTIQDPHGPPPSAEHPPSCLRIMSGEAFAMEFAWPTPPRVSRPIKLTSFIEGSLWSPL